MTRPDFAAGSLRIVASLILIVALGACETTDETSGTDTGPAPPVDASVSSDVTEGVDGSSPDDASATLDNGSNPTQDGGAPEPDAVIQGCVDNSECDDLDPCTHNVCDVETGVCEFPIDQISSDPACADVQNECGDGVCDPEETKDTCPEDCHGDGPGPDPEPADGSCAGKCGEYDAAASCQCDSSCETYGDCCADYAELCMCDPLNPPSCNTDEDCGSCNAGGDLCAGVYACVSGLCSLGNPVVCDTSGDTECLTTTCDSWTGECMQNADAQVCEDGDYCTLDVCDDIGACVFEPIETCGENYACLVSEAPTSNDEAINACVCDGVGVADDSTFIGDSYCCESSWDSLCVQEAQDHCGVNCSCEDLAAEESEVLACETDEDCGWCNPENPCDGAWACLANVCTQQDKIECDASGDTECLKNLCDPATLHCEMTESFGACDDEDPCTLDSCSDEGACVHEAGCGTNHPCSLSSFPQSKDEELNACVCEGTGSSDASFEGDSWCCENGWDSICINEAIDYCGAICDCNDPAFDGACEGDEDCVFCAEDVCVANWGCVQGECQETGPLVCEVDDAAGCVQNSCNPAMGGCEVIPSNASCDDGDACTWDFCDVETEACTNDVIPGCAGEPPFECLGGAEPSAQGCDAVATYEGCCDPWGRVLWCGTDENTYCEDCAGAAFCGWSSSWYWCGVEEPNTEDPAGDFPYQCSGLEYAP